MLNGFASSLTFADMFCGIGDDMGSRLASTGKSKVRKTEIHSNGRSSATCYACGERSMPSMTTCQSTIIPAAVVEMTLVTPILKYAKRTMSAM